MASPIVTNTSAQLNGGSLVVGFSTVLTDAQIKTLPTTPVSCVSAPGAGLRLKVVAATLYIHSLGAYTNVDTTNSGLIFSYTDFTDDYLATGPCNISTLASPLVALSTFLNGSSYVYDCSTPFSSVISAGAKSGDTGGRLSTASPAITLASIENKAIFLSLDNNSAGVLTGGNGSNTLTATVYVAYEAVS
jgi:hypothetical protein